MRKLFLGVNIYAHALATIGECLAFYMYGTWKRVGRGGGDRRGSSVGSGQPGG